MEDIKYIVGIDFGHGETTANYIEILDKEKKKYSGSKRLQIKDRIYTIRSFYCQYKTPEAKRWNYDLDPNDTRIGNYIRKMLAGEYEVLFHHSFKVPMKTDSYKEDVFGQFVKCVYENIVAHNGRDSLIRLDVNESNEPQNFILYAACPSGWSDEQRESFKIFLKRNGVPCEKVFKESDAAWVSFIPQRMDTTDNPRMLVVDYGSSTIDLTWSEDNQRDICNPNTLGASRVEEDIFNYLMQNNRRAQEEYNKVKDLLQDDFFAETIIQLGIRRVKEDFYSQIINYPDDKELELQAYFLSNTFPKTLGLTYFGEELSLNAVERILDPYIQEVEEYLMKFKNSHMKKSGRYITPRSIVLTGGASRMNFVKELVTKVFEVEPYIDKDKASESISFGVALAGTRDFLSGNQIELPYPDGFKEGAIRSAIQNIVNEKIQAHVLSLLNSIFDSWQEGNIVMDTEHNLHNDLIEISEKMKSQGDVGNNNFDVWYWVKQNATNGKEFNNGNRSIHALFYAIMDSVKGVNKKKDFVLLDNITQSIVGYYNNEIESDIVPSLLNYVKIYAPLTTEVDLKKLITLKLERIDAVVEISNEAQTQFLTILVKTAYQTIQDKDFSGVYERTLNKDRNDTYRNGYFDDLRNDFETFITTIETRIMNLDQVVCSISNSIVKKMDEIQNYCTTIKI